MISRDWDKSSYSSGGNGNCVECSGEQEHAVRMRDTQHRELGHLSFDNTAWTDFARLVRSAAV